MSCKTGFTQNANDRTKCVAEASKTSTGTVCPDGSFGSGTSCRECDPACQTCSGATSNDCILCAAGTYLFDGSCVSTDSNGVCEGGQLIADNNKHVCDSESLEKSDSTFLIILTACGAKCTSCRIPGFSAASTVDQLECTGCLAGSFLSDGACIDSCPTGTFVNPSDNSTCTGMFRLHLTRNRN